jgi:hypothetical protein
MPAAGLVLRVADGHLRPSHTARPARPTRPATSAGSTALDCLGYGNNPIEVQTLTSIDTGQPARALRPIGCHHAERDELAARPMAGLQQRGNAEHDRRASPDYTRRRSDHRPRRGRIHGTSLQMREPAKRLP